MDNLSWSGPAWEWVRLSTLDDELDEYRLLAYIQRIDARFRERKLYPHLDELRLRVEQLTGLRDRTEALEAGMAGEITGLDIQRGRVLRKQADRSKLLQVHGSLERALRELRHSREQGSELREELNESIRCAPVGILPIGTREGWFLLRQGNEALAYSYNIPLVQGAGNPLPHSRVRTQYFSTWTLGIGRTYAHIKAELARLGPLPNPATFVFESDLTLPRIETFIPLAKRMVYELLGTESAVS